MATRFIIWFGLFLSSIVNSYSQKEKDVEFKTQKTLLAVPAFLPGIMSDSTFLKNDTLYYNLQGQVFSKPFQVIAGQRFSKSSSPWKAMFNMATAYAKKDKEAIIALYNSGSQKKVRDFLSKKNAEGVLSSLSNATKADLKLLAWFKYKEGILVFSKDNLMGVHENYLIRENNEYKLSALTDSSAMAWNIGLYFRFDPRPMIAVTNVSLPDSLKLNDSVRVEIPLNESGRWVTIFKNEPQKAITALIHDNDVNDKNPQSKKISYYLKGKRFLKPGNYTLYISSFNYPVQRVSQNFFNQASRHIITIY